MISLIHRLEVEVISGILLNRPKGVYSMVVSKCKSCKVEEVMVVLC